MSLFARRHRFHRRSLQWLPGICSGSGFSCLQDRDVFFYCFVLINYKRENFLHVRKRVFTSAVTVQRKWLISFFLQEHSGAGGVFWRRRQILLSVREAWRRFVHLLRPHFDVRLKIEDYFHLICVSGFFQVHCWLTSTEGSVLVSRKSALWCRTSPAVYTSCTVKVSQRIWFTARAEWFWGLTHAGAQSGEKNKRNYFFLKLLKRILSLFLLVVFHFNKMFVFLICIKWVVKFNLLIYFY